MGEIYANATKTLIWIGEETEDTKGWAEALIRVRRHFPEDINSIDFESHTEYWNRTLTGLSTEQLEESIFFTKDWTPVRMLLRRPWFCRKWVIQEVVRSRDPYLVSSHTRLSRSIFQDILDGLGKIDSLGAVSIIKTDKIASTAFRNAAIITRFREYHTTERSEGSILRELLYSCADFQCSDLRDHIYGVLGLATDIEDRNSRLRPNYSLTVEKAFQNFALWAILDQKSIAHFSWQLEPSSSKSNLPSWALNLSKPILNLGKSPAKMKFRASGDSNLSARVIDDVKLGISGRVLDQISRCGALEYAHFTDEERAMVGHGSKWADRVGHRLRKWRDECKEIAFGQCHVEKVKEHPMDDAFWRTLIWDQMDSRGHQRAIPEFANEVSKFLDEFLEMMSTKAYEEHPTETNQFAIKVADAQIAIERACTNRRLCITINSRLGSVPNIAQPGDKICIFHGGNVPYVIRPHGNGEYTLIGGGCYLHGIMDGEATLTEGVGGELIVLV